MEIMPSVVWPLDEVGVCLPVVEAEPGGGEGAHPVEQLLVLLDAGQGNSTAGSSSGAADLKREKIQEMGGRSR